MIKDAMDRVLHLGDKLMITTGQPALYTLVDVQPVLDPRAPKGTVQVTLQSTLPMMAKDGQRLPGFVRIMTVAEQQLGEMTDQKPGGDGGEDPNPEKKTLRLT